MNIARDPTRSRILRAFWHRTRKEFVPLTVDEICRRAKCTAIDARPILFNFAQTKLARAHNTGAGQYAVTTWELSHKGQQMATAQITLNSPVSGVCDPAQPGYVGGAAHGVTSRAATALPLTRPEALNPLPANGGAE